MLAYLLNDGYTIMIYRGMEFEAMDEPECNYGLIIFRFFYGKF